MMKKNSIKPTDIVLLLLALASMAGMATVFHPCGPMEDGGWMRCHWAWISTLGAESVLLLLSVLRLFVRSSGIKAGMSIACIPVALLAALTPGLLIPLCSMKDMRCHALTRPAAVVLSLLVVAAATADLFVQPKGKKA